MSWYASLVFHPQHQKSACMIFHVKCNKIFVLYFFGSNKISVGACPSCFIKKKVQ
jgi:hypothetical protein